ncbi:MAG: SDR family oxidoreductase [Jaaginema sp. PMC 1079.18]|nr:SDR family oxidoreductase [Jaaginema sp. PMC 1080.18]MEC4849385.1 SDR family oxidoreductase [Jaaginema sp. PMC 1079.18]MEC4865418.1 SDR family oxidoreductase [Jaaginema sp. PMC 1078.18]
MSTALITGASSGIGEAFARQLAAQKYNLVLVARSRIVLEQLAQELRDRHQIQATVITQDLTEPNAPTRVWETTQTQGIAVDFLINNAGFGDYGAFVDNSREKQLNMIQLNVTALVDLTTLFLPPMLERGSGQIINVSSIAAFQPMPYLAIYGATKTFILHFSEALWGEYRDRGIAVLAVCPGPTKTNFFDVAGFDPFKTPQEAEKEAVSPEYVVREALEALKRGEVTIVPGGLSNQAIANVHRFLPRQLTVKAIEQQFRPASRSQNS